MVLGITDIDDKIIARAAERKEDIKTLTNHYEMEFEEDMKSLNVLTPTFRTRVTDFVPQIITFIQSIIDKGQGYITKDGSVYFDTKKFPAYGKLFPAQAVESDLKTISGKHSPLDFALWKGAKPGEPWWPSPWGAGKGRPGWHIECSTMASAVFGESVDIHSGGIDLLFPHHENEEAQSCVAHGVGQWVNYWLHAGHLHLKDDVKMSKSLNNTISIRDLLQKYTGNEFRFFCLLSRYRNGVEFSEASMDNAVAICKKVESFLSDVDGNVKGQIQGVVDEPQLMEALRNTQVKFKTALTDDFNTPRAINAIVELIGVSNKMLHNKTDSVQVSYSPTMPVVSSFVRNSLNMFGVDFARQESGSDVSGQLESIIEHSVEFRSQVRSSVLNPGIVEKEKFLLKSCDQLRDGFKSAGVVVMDHGKTSHWNFVCDKKETKVN